MAPPAVFALPFFNLYSAIGLFDTPWAVALAHCLFNVPLAVWILEGFMSGVPREIDETAYLDGYSFPRFFVKIFMPLIASGIGVAAFFCFMFSWVELLLARTLTTVNAKPIAATMTRTVSAPPAWIGACSPPPACSPSSRARSSSGSSATTSPRALPWAASEEGGHGKHRLDGLDLADRAASSRCHRAAPRRHDLARRVRGRRRERVGVLAHPDDARRPPVHLACSARRSSISSGSTSSAPNRYDLPIGGRASRYEPAGSQR